MRNNERDGRVGRLSGRRALLGIRLLPSLAGRTTDGIPCCATRPRLATSLTFPSLPSLVLQHRCFFRTTDAVVQLICQCRVHRSNLQHELSFTWWQVNHPFNCLVLFSAMTCQPAYSTCAYRLRFATGTSTAVQYYNMQLSGSSKSRCIATTCESGVKIDLLLLVL